MKSSETHTPWTLATRGAIESAAPVAQLATARRPATAANEPRAVRWIFIGRPWHWVVAIDSQRAANETPRQSPRVRAAA